MIAPLERARRLARRSRAVAPPNPWVGAVIERDGVVVGVGRTAHPGGPHAEVAALAAAGALARGAQMSVTLEPCAHHGRTPPCVDAIIEAGVARVEVGLIDPDPRVRGRGIQALQAAGVEVRLAPRAMRARLADDLAPYLSHRLRGRPFVVGKIACSLDGAVADRWGQSKWITQEAARELGHRLRAEVDAIVVGRGTFERDRPQLTARPGGRLARRQPVRVVASRRPLDVPEGFVVASESPGALLAAGAARGWVEVLVEGGPTLLGAYLAEGLVDELLVAIAPILLGDEHARHAVDLGEGRLLEDAIRGAWRAHRRVGEDLVAWVRLPAATALEDAYWGLESQVLGAIGCR